MHTKLHSRDFGVLEIILSIAILAAFSVSVLQLFVAAAKDKQRMLDLDRADFAAVSLAEQFKGGATPFALSKTLGGAACGGTYARTASVASGLTARVTIRKSEENAGGALYTVDIAVHRGRDGAQVCHLSSAKYFPSAGTSPAAQAGDGVG